MKLWTMGFFLRPTFLHSPTTFRTLGALGLDVIYVFFLPSDRCP